MAAGRLGAARGGLRGSYLRKAVFGEEEEGEERDCAAVVARNRFWVDPSSARNGIPTAPEQEPHREPRHDAWEQLFHLAHVEQPACLPADEDEPDLEGDREQNEESPRHPRTPRDEDRPGRAEQRRESAQTHRCDRTSRVRRAARAMSAEAPVPTTAIAM